MAIFKILLEIQGGLLDLWNVKSLSTGQEYNEKLSRIDYLIWINKDAMILEFKDVKFSYASEKDRDRDLLRIKQKLDEHETVMILWDEEGLEEAVKKEYGEADNIDEDEDENEDYEIGEED